MNRQLKLTWAIIKSAFFSPNQTSIFTWNGNSWIEEKYSDDEIKNCPTCNGAGVIKK